MLSCWLQMFFAWKCWKLLGIQKVYFFHQDRLNMIGKKWKKGRRSGSYSASTYLFIHNIGFWQWRIIMVIVRVLSVFSFRCDRIVGLSYYLFVHFTAGSVKLVKDIKEGVYYLSLPDFAFKILLSSRLNERVFLYFWQSKEYVSGSDYWVSVSWYFCMFSAIAVNKLSPVRGRRRKVFFSPCFLINISI